MSGLIYSYEENVNPSLEEQLDFAERNDINIIVVIKEKVSFCLFIKTIFFKFKVYQTTQKVSIKTRTAYKYRIEKECTLEEFTSFLTRMYKPSKKMLKTEKI